MSGLRRKKKSLKERKKRKLKDPFTMLRVLKEAMEIYISDLGKPLFIPDYTATVRFTKFKPLRALCKKCNDYIDEEGDPMKELCWVCKQDFPTNV